MTEWRCVQGVLQTDRSHAVSTCSLPSWLHHHQFGQTQDAASGAERHRHKCRAPYTPPEFGQRLWVEFQSALHKLHASTPLDTINII